MGGSNDYRHAERGGCSRFWLPGRHQPARCRRLLRACLLGLMVFSGQAGAAPVLNPDNGHFYEAVQRPSGVGWDAASAAAGERTHNGMRGHLATITTHQENEFIARTFPHAVQGRYCLGGFQIRGIRDPMAGWQWVTGEPWSFTNWNRLSGGEPNDYYGLGTTAADENKLQFFENTGGRWNDVRPNIPVESLGYVVEFEPEPSANAPTITGYSAEQTRDTALLTAPPGALMRITGANLGREGTVLFEGVLFPAAVATWSPTEILVWVPTAPRYPFETRVTVLTDRLRAEGSAFTIAAPTAGRDNLLANGSFEYPDSSPSEYDEPGYTYGPPVSPDRGSYKGYSIPGWRIPIGTIDVTRFGWRHAPGQGRQSIDLVGTPYAAILSQTLYTQSGRDYTFSCWIAQNPGIPSATALVWANDELVQYLFYEGITTFDDMRWGRISFRFRARTSQTTLTLQDVTGRNYFQGLALDGLSLTLAPN